MKKEQHNEAYGTTEWTLKNGARIIVKPTKFKADEVYLAVKSRGGLSLLPDEEYYAAKLLPGIMQMSGLGKFTATDLRKQLAGKQAQTALTVNGYNHGMYGEASPRDLETLLQLVYLSFTSPRFDETDYNTYMTQMRAQVANMLANPDYIVQDAFKETVYGNNYREQMLSPEILDDVRFEQLRTVYDKLYTGANNFTFTFVGDVDPAVLKPLVERYIGSLPATKKTLDWADDGVAPVKGVTTNDFRAAMLQPKVSVWYNYSGDLDFTIENRLAMSFLEQVLTSRYRVSVREEKGRHVRRGRGLPHRVCSEEQLPPDHSVRHQRADGRRTDGDHRRRLPPPRSGGPERPRRWRTSASTCSRSGPTRSKRTAAG